MVLPCNWLSIIGAFKIRRGVARFADLKQSFYIALGKRKFFTLLGKTQLGRNIEHEMIRKWFKERAFHCGFSLRKRFRVQPCGEEAFVAEQLLNS